MTFFNKNISGDTMKAINRYINAHYLPDKSAKSLWKLLNGTRTQQTYFDAVMQNMLPVYELYPNVSLHAVERLVKKQDTAQTLKLYPYFYYASEVSFMSLVLLLQTVSEYLYRQAEYLPSTNRLFIQQHIKRLFLQIKNEDRFLALAKEIETLTQLVEEKTGSCYFIHLLSGHDITPTSIERIAHQYDKTIDEIQSHIFTEKNMIIHLFKTQPFEILGHLYVRAPLHLNTEDTYQRLLQGYSLEHISSQKNVRIHTIQDHVIEIMIKDYPVDTSRFITESEYEAIKSVLNHHHFGKLKSYYALSPIKDYFKLKVAIVKYQLEQCI